MSVKKANLFSNSKTRKINPNWFTAKVHMTEISGIIDSKEQHMYHVYFENGAKTKLHTHNGNQILIVTKGRGVLETFSKTGNKKDNFGIKKPKKLASIQAMWCTSKRERFTLMALLTKGVFFHTSQLT